MTAARKILVAALAALLGTSCAPRDAEWARAYLATTPTGAEAAAAYRLLLRNSIVDRPRHGPEERAVTVADSEMY